MAATDGTARGQAGDHAETIATLVGDREPVAWHQVITHAEATAAIARDQLEATA